VRSLFALSLNIRVQTYRLGKEGYIRRCQSVGAAWLAAVLRAESIAIAVASFVVEGLADALVEIPTGFNLGLVLAAAEVPLIPAHVAVDIVWKNENNADSLVNRRLEVLRIHDSVGQRDWPH